MSLFQKIILKKKKKNNQDLQRFKQEPKPLFTREKNKKKTSGGKRQATYPVHQRS